jgi:hypothetical protein
LIKFMEIASMKKLTIPQQILLTGMYQTMKKAMNNGRN